MQQRLRELSLNSSLPLSPSSPSPEKELFPPKTRSLPRSSSLTQSSTQSAPVPSRRSEPLPFRGHRQQRSFGVRDSISVGTSSSSDCTESIEGNDLERHSLNPIRLRHWPLVEKASSASDTARPIALSAWPLSSSSSSSSDVPDGAEPSSASVLRRNWSCGNPYVPDPVTIRQHPNENPAQCTVTTTLDRIQMESEDRTTTAAAAADSRTRMQGNSRFLPMRSEYGPLNVSNSSSSSSYYDRPLRNELMRRRSDSPSSVGQSSKDSLLSFDLVIPLEAHRQKQGLVGKRGGESHAGLMSRFRQFKRSRRHDDVTV